MLRHQRSVLRRQRNRGLPTSIGGSSASLLIRRWNRSRAGSRKPFCGSAPSIFHQGSRRSLWRQRQTVAPGHGHPRPPDRAKITLPERMRRPAHWLDPKELFGSCDFPRRDPPALDPQIVCGDYNQLRTHLWFGKDTPIGRPIQRSSDMAAVSTSRRALPSVLPNLISERHSLSSR